MQYTIQQAAKISGISAHTLRYYDRQGLLPWLGRNDSGFRSFSEEDLHWLELVNCLKQTGMSIENIHRYAELCKQGETTLHQRLELFQQQRETILAQMEELKRHLATVERKIQIYQEECAAFDAKGAQENG